MRHGIPGRCSQACHDLLMEDEATGINWIKEFVALRETTSRVLGADALKFHAQNPIKMNCRTGVCMGCDLCQN